MTIAPVWIGSPHFYPQTGIVKRHITLHWMVGNLLGTDRAFNGSRLASSTYGVENGVIHQYVQEKDYPFSDGNTYANRYGISIENAGGWVLPDGTRFKPSPDTHETTAQLCADIARRHGWGALVAVGNNLFPHSHWVATACPGSLDIAWIGARANEILAGAPATVPATVTGPAAVGVSEEFRKVQARLIELGYDLGSWGADGIRGSFSITAIKNFQRHNGLVDDGIPGPLTRAKLWPASVPATPQPPAFPLPAGSYFGPKSGPQKSVSGYFSHRADLKVWQQRMHDRGWTITVDGLYGDQTAAVAFAFQTEKGLTRDKWIGPETWNAAWTQPIT